MTNKQNKVESTKNLGFIVILVIIAIVSLGFVNVPQLPEYLMIFCMLLGIMIKVN